MYGAILGDMIGAPYEFDLGDKTKDFPLFCADSHYTDDTVMTIAVAEALLDHRFEDDDAVKIAVVDAMQRWGRRYPNAGYGSRFVRWLCARRPEPYGSYGNGSAMRVSAAGWLFDTIEETRAKARLTAEVTHNHPEGIKGAEATASAIFLARTGHSKDEIKAYITRAFGYDLSRTCDQIRPDYHHVESCQETVPEAITAFLEGTDFEDVIRTAVSLGGDCDTLTCIAGGIAEAFYGVPEKLKDECRSRLPKDMLDILGRFEIAREHGQDPFPASFLSGNTIIEEAIARYYQERIPDNLYAVVNAILYRMHAGGHFLIPTAAQEDGTSFELHHIRDNDGKLWLAVFTSREEYEKGREASVLSYFIDAFLEMCADMQEEGIVINPWGQSFLLTKDLINLLLQVSKEGSAT